MYQYFNNNPLEKNVGDCVIRALSKALNLEWYDTFILLCSYALKSADMPSSNAVWGEVLTTHGFKTKLPQEQTNVRLFSDQNNKGCYVLALSGHTVAVIDGVYFDSWDSGNETILYYFERC